MTATAREYFEHLGHKDDTLFVLLYDTIVQDSAELSGDANVGSEQHYEKAWQWCKHRASVSLSRWFQLEARCYELLETRGLELLILLYLGTKRG